MDLDAEAFPAATVQVALGRLHARRLRDMYRSAGWPCQDAIEVDLLAAGLLQRVADADGRERLRLTDAGITHLAGAQQVNRQALSAHDALVHHIARAMLRDGRVVWTQLSLRARLPDLPVSECPQGRATPSPPPEGGKATWGGPAVPPEGETPKPRWKICRPDVFSIRNTTVPAYLEPVVHEIKVSRADLLGDLRVSDKRDSYLGLGGQCWYVLGCDRKGRPIAEPEEVPDCCGVLMARVEGDAVHLEVARHAPRAPVRDLPFALWMELAKATPLPRPWAGMDDPDQALLQEPPA